jgi:hypothetical protein
LHAALICTLLPLLQKAASHGFFVNLDAVLLKLCGPFLEPGSGVFWKRVDPSYVTLGSRLNFKEVRYKAKFKLWQDGYLTADNVW